MFWSKASRHSEGVLKRRRFLRPRMAWWFMRPSARFNLRATAMTGGATKVDSAAGVAGLGVAMMAVENFAAEAGVAADRAWRAVPESRPVLRRRRRQSLPATGASRRQSADHPSHSRAPSLPVGERTAMRQAQKAEARRLVAAVLEPEREDKPPAAPHGYLPRIPQCGRVQHLAPPPRRILPRTAPVQAYRVHCFQPGAKVLLSASPINLPRVRARGISATLADLNFTARPESSKREPWFGTGRN